MMDLHKLIDEIETIYIDNDQADSRSGVVFEFKGRTLVLTGTEYDEQTDRATISLDDKGA